MRVCFVALNALPAIDPDVSGPIGGIETRSWLLARGLASRPGMDVQFVVRHSTRPPHEIIAGVRIVPLIDPLYPVWQSVGHALERQTRWPWIRVRHWRASLAWQLPVVALDRLVRGRIYAADTSDPRLVALLPDVYVTFGVQTHSARVIRSAQQSGRPTVLMLGSDGDLDPIFAPEGSGIDPYGTRAEVGRLILESADCIVAQTVHQQRRLVEQFGRSASLFPNPIDDQAWDAGLRLAPEMQFTAGLQKYVLWIGRAEELHKRPQLCLEVARRCPQIDFLMVLNPRDPVVEARIRAQAPANVRIVDRVPAPQMAAVFSRAAALLSTSQLEGFPNVFLQAALSGVPVLSLEVGSEFLSASRAGWCAKGDLSSLAGMLSRVWANDQPSGYDRAAARAFVVEQHGLHGRIEEFAALLNDVIHSLPQADDQSPAGTRS